ncbi:hypothetical protein D3C71_1067360 [compost metagenome]
MPCEAVQQTFHAITIDDHRLREQLARWRSIVDQTVLETGDQRLANGALRNAVHTLQQTLVALGGLDGIAFADDQAKLLGHFGRLAYVRRALLLIGVEQPRAGDATLNQRQLPDETHGITNSLAHALSKKRRGHVRGITKKEDSLTTPFLENQRMETVGRRTPDVVVVDVQPAGEQVPDRFWFGNFGGYFIGVDHELPAAVATRPYNVGARSLDFAILDVGGRQRSAGTLLEHHIDHQPGFVELQVLHTQF